MALRSAIPGAAEATRLVAWLVVLIAVTAAARADEARNVPASGSKLTYRFVTTTTRPGFSVTAGEVYTYIVTAADDKSAEGVIKPIAMIMQCTGVAAADPACKRAAQAPNAHLDGELLTVPIASERSDSLAKHGHFKYAYFIQEARAFPVPNPRTGANATPGDVDPEPAFVLRNSFKCDLAGLASFLPLGAAPHVALPCETTFERSAAPKLAAAISRDRVTLDVSFAGNGSVTLPSGNWEVKKLAFRVIPQDPSHAGSEGESLFSPQLGALVKTHTIGKAPAMQSTTETTVELISVEP